MAVKMRPMGLRTFNNATPKPLHIPWYDPDNAEEKAQWEATPEEDRDHLTVAYSREKYTATLEREMSNKMKSGLPGGMLAVMLRKVLVDWELYHLVPEGEPQLPLILTPREDHPEDEELTINVGEKIPLTARCLDQICNIAGMARIAAAMAEDNRPNATKSAPSSNIF